jgi:hypothetical protein
MPSIAAVVGQLTAAPKPVICLDTCDILEVVQCLDWEGRTAPRNVACVSAAQQLLGALADNPNRAQIIITELVATEWGQNIAEICANATRFLAQVDGIVERTYEAAAHAGIALPGYTNLSASTLVDALTSLSQALLDQAIRLDLDTTRTASALDRVMAKQRPSHDGHIKDSSHFEHYLELARQLRASGFTEEFVFVSNVVKFIMWRSVSPPSLTRVTSIWNAT